MRCRPANITTILPVAAMLLHSLFLTTAQEAGGTAAGAPPVAQRASAAGDAAPASSAAPPPAAAPAAEAGMGAEAAEDALFRATLPLDIATASFYDLVAWARSLGLAESGDVVELRKRLYEHYGVSPPPEAAKGEMVVTIERAARASYFELKEGEGGLVRASGGVRLSIVEASGSSHTVEADEIAYDRERGAVTARGNVRYVRKTGTSTEIFTGEALSASIEDWSGVFVDGRVRRAGEGAKEGDRGLVLSAETMLKRTGDVLILERGIISGCDEEDPHYAIRAGKVWLLGDREWAIADAVFSVGRIPVLWLPFFYFPGDELVFHPVFGYRTREGTYVQTTTYLIGEKPKKTETSSILSLASQGSSTTGPLVLKGLFLRRVSGEAPKDKGTLKVMADAYSGLGAFAGVQGSLPKAGPFEKLDFSLGLGLSRSLYNVGTGYSPYFGAGGYKSVWNESEFLGLGLPFRYGLELGGTIKKGPVTATFSLPLLSDPYFDQDFKDRSEDMEWLSFLTSKKDEESTVTARTSLSQRLDLSSNFDTKAVAPWISSFNVSRLGSSINWLSSSRTTGYSNSTLNSVDPARMYFYPNLLRPIDVSMSLRGSLFNSSKARAGAAGGKVASPGQAGGTKEASSPELRSPWVDEPEEPSPAAQDGAGTTGGGPMADNTGPSSAAAPPTPATSAATTATRFRLPERAPSVPRAKQADPWSASVDWNLAPSGFLEDSFRYKDWTEPSQIDFELLYSLLSYKLTGGLDARVAYRSDAATASLSLAYADQAQYRSYLYDQYPYVDKAAAYRLADYQYKARKITGSFRLGAKPLASSWLWSATSLNYTFDATLYGLKYTGIAADKSPIYDEVKLDWDDDSITSHSAGLTIALRPWNLTQSLGLTMSLPPTTESYSAKLSLDGGPLDISIQERIYRPTPAGDFLFDDMTASLTFKLDPWPSVSDTFVFDPELGQPVSNVSTVAWGPLSTSLNMKSSKSYKLDPDSGWQTLGSEYYRPSSLSMVFNQTFKNDKDSRSTWSIATNATLSQSLLRFTESTLALSLTASYKVSELVEISFSGQSQNSAVWRYYPGFFNSSTTIDLEAYRSSLIEDIVDSLSVWDMTALRRGLFKLKSFTFKMVHDLHDWDLTIGASVSPLLEGSGNKRHYVLDPKLSILLKWRDISQIKTEATYDSEGFSY